MKQINSTPHNIASDILGVVTLKGRNIFSRKDCVFVGHSEKTKSGYAATISDCALTGSGAGCVVESVEDFCEGDVVLINSKGEIIFLYEIRSMHNAIFATERCNHRCVVSAAACRSRGRQDAAQHETDFLDGQEHEGGRHNWRRADFDRRQVV